MTAPATEETSQLVCEVSGPCRCLMGQGSDLDECACIAGLRSAEREDACVYCHERMVRIDLDSGERVSL